MGKREPQTLQDVARRRREELLGASIALEMLAEAIVVADDGALIARDHGREYKIEVKAFEIGASGVVAG